MQRVQWLEPDWQAGWGLGFRIIRLGDKTYIGHGGAVHGYRTRLRISPADKIAIIILTNADDGDTVAMMDKAFQWLAPPISKAATPEPEPLEPDPAWGQYTGKYRNAWGDSQVLVLDGELVMIGPTLPDPTLIMDKLVPVAEHTFRVETKDGFGSNGELVIFEMDDTGRVNRVKIDQNYTYPQTEW